MPLAPASGSYNRRVTRHLEANAFEEKEANQKFILDLFSIPLLPLFLCVSKVFYFLIVPDHDT